MVNDLARHQNHCGPVDGYCPSFRSASTSRTSSIDVGDNQNQHSLEEMKGVMARLRNILGDSEDLQNIEHGIEKLGRPGTEDLAKDLTKNLARLVREQTIKQCI